MCDLDEMLSQNLSLASPLEQSLVPPQSNPENPTSHQSQTEAGTGSPISTLQYPSILGKRPIAELDRPLPEDRITSRKLPKVGKVQLLEFVGFVSLDTSKLDATLFATQIYDWPVPKQVTHRAIVWSGFSLRQRQAAAGLAWMKAPSEAGASAPWTTDPNISAISLVEWATMRLKCSGKRFLDVKVELLAIKAAINVALEQLEHPLSDTARHCKPDKEAYEHLTQSSGPIVTKSDCHTKPKEIFVFTESRTAMRMLTAKTLTVDKWSEEQIDQIKALSKQLEVLGIHLEIHCCHNDRRVIGKDLAHEAAISLTKPRVMIPNLSGSKASGFPYRREAFGAP